MEMQACELGEQADKHRIKVLRHQVPGFLLP
jgi:hypothetical protein